MIVVDSPLWTLVILAVVGLAGIGAGALLCFMIGALMVGIQNSVESRRERISNPVLIRKGPKCLRRDLPFGSFFDGNEIRFNCNLPPDIEEELIARGFEYKRLPDDTIVQPCVMAIHRESATRGIPVPDSWVDEFNTRKDPKP